MALNTSWLLYIALALTLSCICYYDSRQRIVPNSACVVVLILGLVDLLLAHHVAIDQRVHMLWLFIVVGGASLLIYALGWLGGGDIKLLLAFTPWFSPANYLVFFIVLTLLGGCLAVIIWCWNTGFNRSISSQESNLSVPYALAISLSSLLLLF